MSKIRFKRVVVCVLLCVCIATVPFFLTGCNLSEPYIKSKNVYDARSKTPRIEIVVANRTNDRYKVTVTVKAQYVISPVAGYETLNYENTREIAAKSSETFLYTPTKNNDNKLRLNDVQLTFKKLS